MEDILKELIGDVFDEDDDDALRRILGTASKFRSMGPKAQYRESLDCFEDGHSGKKGLDYRNTSKNYCFRVLIFCDVGPVCFS